MKDCGCRKGEWVDLGNGFYLFEGGGFKNTQKGLWYIGVPSDNVEMDDNISSAVGFCPNCGRILDERSEHED